MLPDAVEWLGLGLRLGLMIEYRDSKMDQSLKHDYGSGIKNDRYNTQTKRSISSTCTWSVRIGTQHEKHGPTIGL